MPVRGCYIELRAQLVHGHFTDQCAPRMQVQLDDRRTTPGCRTGRQMRPVRAGYGFGIGRPQFLAGSRDRRVRNSALGQYTCGARRRRSRPGSRNGRSGRNINGRGHEFQRSRFLFLEKARSAQAFKQHPQGAAKLPRAPDCGNPKYRSKVQCRRRNSDQMLDHGRPPHATYRILRTAAHRVI